MGCCASNTTIPRPLVEPDPEPVRVLRRVVSGRLQSAGKHFQNQNTFAAATAGRPSSNNATEESSNNNSGGPFVGRPLGKLSSGSGRNTSVSTSSFSRNPLSVASSSAHTVAGRRTTVGFSFDGSTTEYAPIPLVGGVNVADAPYEINPVSSAMQSQVAAMKRDSRMLAQGLRSMRTSISLESERLQRPSDPNSSGSASPKMGLSADELRRRISLRQQMGVMAHASTSSASTDVPRDEQRQDVAGLFHVGDDAAEDESDNPLAMSEAATPSQGSSRGSVRSALMQHIFLDSEPDADADPLTPHVLNVSSHEQPFASNSPEDTNIDCPTTHGAKTVSPASTPQYVVCVGKAPKSFPMMPPSSAQITPPANDLNSDTDPLGISVARDANGAGASPRSSRSSSTTTIGGTDSGSAGGSSRAASPTHHLTKMPAPPPAHDDSDDAHSPLYGGSSLSDRPPGHHHTRPPRSPNILHEHASTAVRASILGDMSASGCSPRYSELGMSMQSVEGAAWSTGPPFPPLHHKQHGSAFSSGAGAEAGDSGSSAITNSTDGRHTPRFSLSLNTSNTSNNTSLTSAPMLPPALRSSLRGSGNLPPLPVSPPAAASVRPPGPPIPATPTMMARAAVMTIAVPSTLDAASPLSASPRSHSRVSLSSMSQHLTNTTGDERVPVNTSSSGSSTPADNASPAEHAVGLMRAGAAHRRSVQFSAEAPACVVFAASAFEECDPDFPMHPHDEPSSPLAPIEQAPDMKAMPRNSLDAFSQSQSVGLTDINLNSLRSLRGLNSGAFSAPSSGRPSITSQSRLASISISDDSDRHGAAERTVPNAEPCQNEENNPFGADESSETVIISVTTGDQ